MAPGTSKLVCAIMPCSTVFLVLLRFAAARRIHTSAAAEATVVQCDTLHSLKRDQPVLHCWVAAGCGSATTCHNHTSFHSCGVLQPIRGGTCITYTTLPVAMASADVCHVTVCSHATLAHMHRQRIVDEVHGTGTWTEECLVCRMTSHARAWCSMK